MFVASRSDGRRKRPVAGLLQQANLKATGKNAARPLSCRHLQSRIRSRGILRRL